MTDSAVCFRIEDFFNRNGSFLNFVYVDVYKINLAVRFNRIRLFALRRIDKRQHLAVYRVANVHRSAYNRRNGFDVRDNIREINLYVIVRRRSVNDTVNHFSQLIRIRSNFLRLSDIGNTVFIYLPRLCPRREVYRRKHRSFARKETRVRVCATAAPNIEATFCAVGKVHVDTVNRRQAFYRSLRLVCVMRKIRLRSYFRNHVLQHTCHAFRITIVQYARNYCTVDISNVLRRDGNFYVFYPTAKVIPEETIQYCARTSKATILYRFRKLYIFHYGCIHSNKTHRVGEIRYRMPHTIKRASKIVGKFCKRCAAQVNIV